MPFILENGSDEIRTWLDPRRSEWSKELQSLLKPFQGELDCYPVSKDVGKVGNNSPAFIVPVASTENKHNIANFFSNAKNSAKRVEEKEEMEIKDKGLCVNLDSEERRTTIEQSSTEDNAPLPVPPVGFEKKGQKREHEGDKDGEPPVKAMKSETPANDISPAYRSAVKSLEKKTRSATNNGTMKGSPVKSKNGSSQKLTNFYK